MSNAITHVTRRRALSIAGLCLALMAGGVRADDNAPPSIDAKAWLLTDYHSGRVLAEHKADERREPASLTKLMTAYVLLGDLQAKRYTLDDQAMVSAKAWGMAGARTYLPLNQRVRVEDLFQGMIVQSGNDATLALVEHVAGNEEAFVARMNATAAALGMTNTHYANATGLIQANHYSSARDLNRLAVAFLRTYPEYYQRWYALKEFRYGRLTQRNRNSLLWSVPGADGIKTGHTRSAGFCLIGSAVRDNMRLMATLLGAPDDKARAEGGKQLLDYGFRAYETRLLYHARMPAVTVRVWLGGSDTLPAGIGQDLYLTLPRGSFGSVQAHIDIPQPPTAPIAQDAVIGTLHLMQADQHLGDYPLLALRDVAAGNLVQRILDRVRMWLQ
jgi:D-alanyl-D-alanine carboxypeptidase (penicillin-binding protein 5/6)